MQAQQKKAFDKKVKKKEFKEGDLVMMFDTRHHCKAYKKLLPKWFGPFVIRKLSQIMDLMSLKIPMAHHI